jgi:ribosomal small subunit protein bTHX
MGKGDMRTKRGKICRGTHGKTHPKSTMKKAIKPDSGKKRK